MKTQRTQRAQRGKSTIYRTSLKVKSRGNALSSASSAHPPRSLRLIFSFSAISGIINKTAHYQDAIIRRPIVLLTGAGASSPLNMPTMSDVYDELLNRSRRRESPSLEQIVSLLKHIKSFQQGNSIPEEKRVSSETDLEEIYYSEHKIHSIGGSMLRRGAEMPL